MENPKKVLQLIFTTKEGGSLRLSVGNTRDELSPSDISQAMDEIVEANIFETSTGEVIGKAKARYVTQSTEDIDIQSV